MSPALPEARTPHHDKTGDICLTPQPYETAECNDLTLSFSATASGTCSHHLGVKYWFM